MLTPNDLALLNALRTYNPNGRPKDRHRETQDVYRANTRSKESSSFIKRALKTLGNRLTKEPGPLRQQRPPRDDKVGANPSSGAKVFSLRVQDRAGSHPAG